MAILWMKLILAIILMLGSTDAFLTVETNSKTNKLETSFHAPRIGNKSYSGKSARIVNGQEAQPGEFPWQVVLKVSNVVWGCGGVIIDQVRIVTAAHCLDNVDLATLTIVAGDHDLNSADEHEQERSVSSVVIHSSYSSNNFKHNDIAILHLDAELEFNDRVKEIQLPDAGTTFVGECVVAGWGDSTILQKTSLDIIDMDECQDLYWTSERIEEDQLCAGKYGKHTSACIGDNGQGLICHDANDQQYLAGLVLFKWTPIVGSIPCENDFFPGVYTKISFHRTWIDEQVQN